MPKQKNINLFWFLNVESMYEFYKFILNCDFKLCGFEKMKYFFIYVYKIPESAVWKFGNYFDLFFKDLSMVVWVFMPSIVVKCI